MAHRLSDLKSIARFVIRRFREDSLAQVAGSLTFTTLFALVPLVTIVVTVFSALPVSSRLVASLNAFIVSTFVPGAASRLITVYTQQFAENASRLTAIGIGLLAVTAIMMMATIDRAFNRIWRVHRSPPLMTRMLVYWALLTIGPILIGAGVTFSYWVVTESLGLIDSRGVRAQSLRLLSPLLIFLAFLFLYRAVPNRRVTTADAVAGALAAAVAFEGMRAVFASVVTNFGNYKLVYGAFAGFPVFLLWLYLSWIIVLAGAVLTAALPQVRTGAWSRFLVPGSQYLEALALLRHLREGHVAGSESDLGTLSRLACLTWEDTEALLYRMAERGWVVRTATDRWLLARDPRQIAISHVFEEFAFQGEDLAREARRLGLSGYPWRATDAVTAGTDLEAWCLSARVDPDSAA